MSDQEYMQIALDLAKLALGRTSPNPMVGALVVKHGEIVGRGYHARAGTPHAEVHALREAGENAKGATIYVTLEPCSHYGRTPPCSKAIIEAGINRVVAAMSDPNPLVAGRGFEQLKEAGIQVVTGVLEDEARDLNETFLKYITCRRPFVVMKTAMTLDGKIATKTGHSKWVTGTEARLEVHRLRDRYDGIMVGIGTVLADDPALTVRIPGIKGRDPVRIIVDSMARTPLNATVITQLAVNRRGDRDSASFKAMDQAFPGQGGKSSLSLAPTIITVTENAPEERVRALEEAGAWIMRIPAKDNRVDLTLLMEELAREDITSILLEGGAELNSSMINSGLVDKVASFIAPKILGGREAPGPLGGHGPETMAEAIEVEKLKVSTVGKDIMIEGYIRR